MACSTYSAKRISERVFLCILNKMILKQHLKPGAVGFLVFFLLITSLTSGHVIYADNLKEVIYRASENYKVPSGLIYQVIEAESSFNPYAVSGAGARGLMQITRPTWDWVCQDLLRVSWSFDNDSFNKEKNIIVGTRFLAWINTYLNKHAEELNANHDDLLLACYNAGPGTVRKYGFRVPPFKETRNYITRINSSLK